MATSTLDRPLKSLDELKKNIPWIESPFFESELKKAALSPQMEALVRHYAEEGYVVFDPEVDLATLDRVIEALRPEYAAKNVTRLQDAWTYNADVKEVATAPKVLEVLRVLYRREPIPFQTLNFNVGTQQRTHSDMIHFSSVPQRFMCGVWIAFEDIHAGNGPLHYYPKSHKLPFFDMVDMNLRGSDSRSQEETYGYYAKQYENFIQASIEDMGLKKAILNMKKGQALIWAANLLHGGEKITQEGATRWSQVTHYYFEDCVYYTPLLSDMALNRTFVRQITDIRTGQKVTNKYMGEALAQEHEGYDVAVPPALRTAMIKAGRVLPRGLVNVVKKMLGRS
jgi:ectoine hydroxylase-related dioxygenase (phytanoyl-CoA dioxygenase family)